jgi:thioredoxin 2
VTEPRLVRCPSCGATNRLPRHPGRPGAKVVCGRCKQPLAVATHPLVVTDRTFAAEVEGSDLPVLFDLWAPWCGPCHLIAPTIEQLAGELAGRVKVAKINIDDNPATTARYRVQGIPTLLILRGGREVDRLVGVQSKEQILARIRAVVGDR